jgi:hypothetical protein
VSGEACLICGATLERPATGRPPTYCGVPCRRAAELERGRLDRRLERLEDSAAKLRFWGTAQRQLPEVEAEIERVRARLLALLGPEEGVSPASESGG